MKTQNRYLVILITLALLFRMDCGVLFAQHEGHDHDHEGEKAAAETFNWNVGQGNIEFYMSGSTVKYSGYTSDGTHQTGNHSTSNEYIISGSGSSSLSGGNAPVVKIGTPSAAVDKDIVIYLNGPSIAGPHRGDGEDAPPIYVNNSAGTVYLILKDGTSTYLKGYGRHDVRTADAAIEKEAGATGTLVVTCEKGYAAYKNDSQHNSGHTCTDSDNCGVLTAIASGSNKRSGTLQINCGAAIGTAGRKEGALNNLVIAGGKITASTMFDNMTDGHTQWHMTEASQGNVSGEDLSSYAPGIGVGSAGGASQNNVPSGYIKITGGKITAKAGNGSPACIGGGYRSGDITVDIYGGNITATERVYSDANHRGAGIGAGGGGDSSGAEGTGTVNIYGGTITASSQYGAAIGGSAGGTNGGAQPAVVTISGGNITATTTVGGGAAIGSGGSTGTGRAAQATVTIEGGTVSASSKYGADIGGGGTNSSSVNAEGGKGIVTISGGTITTTKGGIGGGNANAGPGGDAEVTVEGGTISTTSIGGGNSTSNTGGEASIYITGGSLTCKKFIGGGDSDTGTPGSVSSSVSGRAGVHITGSNKITLKAGYIGGGTNSAGDIGKATVYINATHAQSTIQGQFILSSTSSTAADHCYFTMLAGTINNTNLGAIGASSYPRKKESGGAVYMTDDYGVVTISGGTIKNCKAPDGYGGAVYMDYTSSVGNYHGSFTLSGSAVIESCEATGGTADGAVGRGGAVFMTAGSFTMSGGTIRKCTAENRGGAVYQSGGTMTISGGTIGGNSLSEGNKGLHGGGVYSKASFTMTGGNVKYNQTTDAAGDGGGLCISSGADVVIKGGTIEGNQSNDRGGGLYLNPGGARTIYINSKSSTTTITSNTAKRGAGAFVNSGTLNINSAATTISDNIASNLGGGFYVNGGTVNDTASLISGNTAATHGGGIYSTGGTVNLISANVTGNTATSGNGGGIYANNTVTVTGGSIGTNHADSGSGGGIYADATGKTITIQSSAQINGNTAKDGAGIFTQAGDIEVLTSSKITGNVASNQGGGLYSNGGTTTINCSSAGYIGASSAPNSAKYGGGIYANGGTVNVTTGFLQYNEATQDGGAIYANGGTVNVQYSADNNGTVRFNSAKKRGGALFISSTGTLNLKNHSTIEKNHVPLGCLGGGVYLLGTVVAGNSSSDVITVATNYAANTAPTTYDPVPYEVRNNIYLPDPKDTQTKDVITIVKDKLDRTNSRVGFSVPGNYVPVIYCSNAAYIKDLYDNYPNTVFEDSHRFNTYYSTVSPYKPTYIYLYSPTWVSAVQSAPSGFNISNIDSEEDLAWLISLVNGSNGVSTPSTYSGQTINITKDLDMSAHGWVPIGMAGHTFNGTFNGGGHVIKGIYCSYLTGDVDHGTGTGLGLFGVTNGATIHDLFITDAQIMVKNQNTGTYSMGTLVNSATNTTIYNCSVSAELTATITATMGGLVGNFVSGTIHSSSAMPVMTGYTMGGLVGTNTGGAIYNSFANPQFTYSGAANECFVGGLVATTSSTVQNCYVRFTRESSFANSAKFGRLAGDAGSSKISLCYTPATCTTVPAAIQNAGTLGANCKTYGNVAAPYLYSYSESSDNIVTGTGKTLCKMLNDNRGSYVEWKRTTAGSYSADAGDINGDCPIHHYRYIDNSSSNTAYNSAASTDGVDLDYATSLDAMLSRHVANSTINLYANDANVTGSTGEGVVVYIDEDVSLLQDVSGSKTTSVIEAYTAQTMKTGSNSRWHFFSSSLSDSGIGFEYDHYSEFNYLPDPCGLSFTDAGDDYCIMPTDILDEGGIEAFDFYMFYEPRYHWINLKRRSDSHWHMDAHTMNIPYTNETELVPCRGYLVSVDKNQLLQNRGTLNNGYLDIDVTKTDAIAFSELMGYNLLGNPYQSYLDFALFASNNSSLWIAKSPSEYTYAVYSAEDGAYLQYKDGASKGAKSATGLLNPHQGFLVRVTSASTKAKFNNGMRSNSGTPNFRGEQPAYPLVNFKVTDDAGDADVAVLELGRAMDEGAEKLRANTSKGWLYLRHNNEDYAILFRNEVENYQPLWFEATEAGTYTLSWETANAEFDELTLIDNITGKVTDMLTRDSYVFEADPEQYKSRFKIVVGDWKGVEENNGPSTEAGTFAYYADGEIHLVETQNFASLQIVDMLGRVIRCSDVARNVSTDGIAPGVYVLRLTTDNRTRTQKIILE